MTKNTISHSELHTDQGIYSSLDIEKLIQENENLFQKNEDLHNHVSQLSLLLEEAQKRIGWFEEQIKLARQRQFGKQSEKLDNQQEIIFDADETLQRNISYSPLSYAIETKVAGHTRRKKTVGRRIDTSLLLRTQEIHDLTEAQKVCSCCGGTLHKVRDEISETIETIPEQKYVVEHIHPQYGCRPWHYDFGRERSFTDSKMYGRCKFAHGYYYPQIPISSTALSPIQALSKCRLRHSG